MERCPVEVWQKILVSACTDGGYTGNSLSLVSRFMRDAVEPVRFHSVMLIDHERCIALATLLNHSRSQTTIRHLFVNAPIAPGDPELARKRDDLTKALTSILTRARPTLVTLFIYNNNHFSLSNCELRFPVLRDLAVHTLSPYNLAPELDYPFPVLERLHIRRISNGYDIHCLDPWVGIAILAPTISSLKLTADAETPNLPKFIRMLLGIPFPEIDQNKGAILLTPYEDYFYPGSEMALRAEVVVSYLSRLKYITLESRLFPEPGWCTLKRATGFYDMEASLKRLSYTYSPRDEGDVKLCLLPK